LKILLKMWLVQKKSSTLISQYSDVNIDWWQMKYVSQWEYLWILSAEDDGFEFWWKNPRSRYWIMKLLEKVIWLYR
jgi:hypothetical protein